MIKLILLSVFSVLVAAPQAIADFRFVCDRTTSKSNKRNVSEYWVIALNGNGFSNITKARIYKQRYSVSEDGLFFGGEPGGPEFDFLYDEQFSVAESNSSDNHLTLRFSDFSSAHFEATGEMDGLWTPIYRGWMEIPEHGKVILEECEPGNPESGITARN